jgi:hypothetical protein
LQIFFTIVTGSLTGVKVGIRVTYLYQTWTIYQQTHVSKTCCVSHPANKLTLLVLLEEKKANTYLSTYIPDVKYLKPQQLSRITNNQHIYRERERVYDVLITLIDYIAANGALRRNR